MTNYGEKSVNVPWRDGSPSGRRPMPGARPVTNTAFLSALAAGRDRRRPACRSRIPTWLGCGGAGGGHK